MSSDSVIQIMSEDITVVHLAKDVDDGVIDHLIHRFFELIYSQKASPFYCTINGYGNDSRDLFEIPEAISLCKRLVERGFISLLTFSPTLDDKTKPEVKKTFGALEIWSVAKKYVNKDGDLVLTKEMLKEFEKDLKKCNFIAKKCAANALG